jgi:hypothetical protein
MSLKVKTELTKSSPTRKHKITPVNKSNFQSTPTTSSTYVQAPVVDSSVDILNPLNPLNMINPLSPFNTLNRNDDDSVFREKAVEQPTQVEDSHKHSSWTSDSHSHHSTSHHDTTSSSSWGSDSTSSSYDSGSSSYDSGSSFSSD